MSTIAKTRNEAANRAVKAARIAEVMFWNTGDARTASAVEWIASARFAWVPEPSPATRAAVTALIDVAAGRPSERYHGSGAEVTAYNVTRKAALIAVAFESVGADEEPTDEQWTLGNQIAAAHVGTRVMPLSSTIREVTQALRPLMGNLT